MSSFDEVVKVSINLYDNYTNSLVNTNIRTVAPNINYWLSYGRIRKDSTIKFIDYESGKVISTFLVEGSKDMSEDDINQYFVKLQSLNNDVQQISLNQLLDINYDHNYKNNVDVESGDTVFDIGFGYGLFSLSAIKKGASEIYGFEPSKTLSEKIKLYPNQNNVKIYNCGIHGTKKTRKFYEDVNSVGSSFTPMGVNVSKSYNVDCLKLEDFVIDNNVDKIDFLNIDCVGDEYSIINNFSDNFLEKIKKIRIKYCRNFNDEITSVINKLKKNRFVVSFEEDRKKEYGILYAKKTYKNIVLISSYCDEEDKMEALVKNLKIIREAGLDSAVISPLPLPEEVVKLTDYFFLTKENIVLTWPTHAMYEWKTFTFDSNQYILTTIYDDYGFSGLQHVKRLGEMFINYDYDFFNYIIYDTVIDDEVLDFLKTGHKKMVFPSQRGHKTWAVGLHLMSFNRENLRKVIDRITIQDYLSYKNFDAFAFLHNHIVIPLDVSIGEKHIKDWIFYYDKKHDKMNFSDVDDLKYFFMSEEAGTDITIFFYDMKSPMNISINVNGVLTDYSVKNFDLINLGVSRNTLEKGEVVINGESYDFKSKVMRLSKSKVEIKKI